MKRLVAFILAVILLCSAAAASADGLPYLRQIPSGTKSDRSKLAPESYRQVVLIPFLPINYTNHDPWVVSFGPRAGACAWSFSQLQANFFDEEHDVSYIYSIGRTVVKSFLDNSKGEKHIVFDDDQRAAYVNPKNRSACGLIYLPEIDEGYSLMVTVSMPKVKSDEAVESLTAAIIDEMNRVEGEMAVRVEPQLWIDSTCAGVKMRCPQPNRDKMLVFDVPTLTRYTEEGAFEARMIITGVDDDPSVEGYVVFAPNNCIEVEVGLTEDKKTFSEKDLEDCAVVTLDRGLECSVQMSGLKKNGRSGFVSAFFEVPGAENLYTSIRLSGYGVRWSSFEEAAADLNEIVRRMLFISAVSDPYVPAATDEPAAQASGENENVWICPACEAENSGNFCTNCGAKRPEDDGKWECPNCKAENDGNFCANCGAKKTQ